MPGAQTYTCRTLQQESTFAFAFFLAFYKYTHRETFAGSKKERSETAVFLHFRLHSAKEKKQRLKFHKCNELHNNGSNVLRNYNRPTLLKKQKQNL